mmetsp:Transcript_17471/g.37581  ORF Transcript_17471/g.37581 Transcript_17471/m.37581 type:complete len:119 (-) Transcript_17471:204-560(-)
MQLMAMPRAMLMMMTMLWATALQVTRTQVLRSKQARAVPASQELMRKLRLLTPTPLLLRLSEPPPQLLLLLPRRAQHLAAATPSPPPPLPPTRLSSLEVGLMTVLAAPRAERVTLRAS